MKLKARGEEYDVNIIRANYGNGNLAIAIELEDGEPFATLTVNIDILMPDYAFVDTNNCPWAEEFIKENNLGEFTGTVRKSGYCSYPLYKFYKEA